MTDGVLSGGWVVDLGVTCPAKDKRALVATLTAHGGTVALTPTSRGASFLVVGGGGESFEGPKVRSALAVGVAVVTREYVDSCVAAGARLDPWPFRWFGPGIPATSLAPSLDAAVVRPASLAAATVIAAASDAYSARVIGAVCRGATLLALLCRGASRKRAPEGATPVELAGHFFSEEKRPAAFAFASAKRPAAAAAAAAPAVAKISSTRMRMEKAKAEREQKKAEEAERKRAEKEARLAESSAGRRGIDSASMREEREEQRREREAEKERRAREKEETARERKAEVERAAMLRRAEVEKAKRERAKVRAQLREAFGRTRATLAKQMTQKSAIAEEMEAEAALANAEVEEAERQRQRAKERNRVRMLRESRRAKEARRARREERDREARIEKLRAKAERREAWVVRKALEDEERKLQKLREWQERVRRREERARKKAEREERNKERKARGLKLLESLGPLHLRKVFAGNLKLDDIATSQAISDSRRAAVRQRRINEFCAIFRRYGKVTQWLPNWEKGYAHIVYRNVPSATRCVGALCDHEDRKAICDAIRVRLEAEEKLPANEAELASPRPAFYVREARDSKAKGSDPDRRQILAEKKEKAEREKKARATLEAAAKAAAGSFRGGRGGGRGRSGRGGGGGGGRGRAALCFNCGMMGHVARDCPSKIPLSPQGEGVGPCEACGESGHIGLSCPKASLPPAAAPFEIPTHSGLFRRPGIGRGRGGRAGGSPPSAP